MAFEIRNLLTTYLLTCGGCCSRMTNQTCTIVGAFKGTLHSILALHFLADLKVCIFGKFLQ